MKSISLEAENQKIVEKAIKKNNVDIAKAIQAEMNAQGMFAKHLVRATGIQKTHLMTILEGKQVITIPTLIKICVALKVELHLDCTSKNGEIVSSFITKTTAMDTLMLHNMAKRKAEESNN